MYGVEPDLTREGGSIPVTLTFQETTGKNVMLLPIGACDDGAHSQNEKINKSNYIQGVTHSFITLQIIVWKILILLSFVYVYAWYVEHYSCSIELCLSFTSLLSHFLAQFSQPSYV